MAETVSLEITLRTLSADSYHIDLRVDNPASAADPRRSGREPVRFDQDRLLQLELDPTTYGQALGKTLFGEQTIRDFFNEALAVAQAGETPLHLRLSIGPTALDLHRLRWETLRLAADGSPLLTGENVRFSRYLSSLDFRPVHLRPKGDLRALIAIANPADVGEYQLGPVDVTGELVRIQTALGDMARTVLATGETTEEADGQAVDKALATAPVTLNNLAASLRDGYDILYLVAHGKLVKGEPYLWLEGGEDGATARVSGSDFVERLRELEQRPSLVVLASCQSAGDGKQPTARDDGALAALGPQLAQAGIPAVVAMQGNVSMETVAKFMPVFFTELRRDGAIDRAMAVARGALRDRADWWMPVLFTRLKRGRIWYTPGFGDQKQGLAQWPALVRAINRGKCTPILGPGLAEPLVGSRRDMAASWARSYSFPMAPHNLESLPQVAQYLSVQQGGFFLVDELVEHVRKELWQRFGDALNGTRKDATLDELLTMVGDTLGSETSPTPYQMLAGLDLPLYITTNPGNLMADALRAEGKDPVVEICRWNTYLAAQPSIFDRGSGEAGYRPSVQRPLVYHLFGRLGISESLVLTEDDYFDFLTGVTSNNDLIPTVVLRALTDSALLFLGFNIGEWDFRVLFRSIMRLEGRSRRSLYAHVAAQIDPEGCNFLEPEGARRYLESYFGNDDISIFWGGVDDFAQALRSQLG